MSSTVREKIVDDVRALASAIAPDAAGCVEACVRRFTRSAWPDVAWRFSALSSDGSPLQFEFSSRDDRLRYCCEAAGPELPTDARLEAALDLIGELGGDAPDAAIVRRWMSLQSGTPLRWGAWVGVRHDGARALPKVYIEVPRDVGPLGLAEFAPVVPSSRPLMIGYDFATRSEEIYFRQHQMNDHELDTFLTFLRQSARRRAALDAFVELCGLPARAAMQWVNFGYSIAQRTPSAEVVFALFVRSRSVGDVSRVRRHFLARDSRSAKRSTYGAVLGTLPADRLPDHEMISLIARGPDEVEMRVGLSALALARLCQAR